MGQTASRRAFQRQLASKPFDHFDDLRQAAGADRMAARFQTARWIDRQQPVDRGFFIERRFAAFAGGEKSQIFRRNDFKRREGIVNFGEIDFIGRYPGHFIGARGGDAGGGERCKDFTIAQAERAGALADAGNAHVGLHRR